MELRCLDLFAGCGGLSLGLEEAGLKVLWANDNDKNAAETYQNSHPDTRMIPIDIEIFYQQLMSRDSGLPQKGDVDLIAGGPPCQGFSGYNRHRSSSDPRNSLMEVFLDFVELLRPPYVLIENVPGMLSLNGGRVPELLIRILDEMGYQTKLGILQAGHYGLPQNRWRVFIWGAQRGRRLPAFPQPTHLFPRTTIFGAKAFRQCVVKAPGESEDLFWKPLPTVTVADAVFDLPPIRNGGGADEMEYGKGPDADYQRALRSDSLQLWDHRCQKLGELMYARCCAIPKRPGAGWLDLPHHLKPKNLLRHGDKRYDNRFGRLHQSGTFNTILSRPHPYWGRVFHPTQNRVISVRESARAQGFPDSLRFCGGLSSRYMQVGNAVPPPLARALAAELLRAAGCNGP